MGRVEIQRIRGVVTRLPRGHQADGSYVRTFPQDLSVIRWRSGLQHRGPCGSMLHSEGEIRQGLGLGGNRLPGGGLRVKTDGGVDRFGLAGGRMEARDDHWRW